MADGLQVQRQDTFALGAFDGFDRIPDGAAESIIDGIINDDGTIDRRGGTTYKTTVDTGNDILGIWDGNLHPGQRTAYNTTAKLWTLDTDDTTGIDLVTGAASFGTERFVEVARMLLKFAHNSSIGYLWGGSRDQPTFTPAAGNTATFTQGDTTVVGAGGTNFTTANFKAGGIIHTGATNRLLPAVIDSVTDATHLLLAEPWPYGTQTITTTWGATRVLERDFASTAVGAPLRNTTLPVVASQIFGRLVLGQGNRVVPSDFGFGDALSTPVEFNSAEEALELPEGVVITGMQPVRDLLIVFTTQGVWAVSGLDTPDPTDFAGNPTQRVEQVNRDLVLWGEAGLASYRGAILVPGESDLWLFDGIGQPQAVTGGARQKYREYLRAGYSPGGATVFRGHFMLPILDGSSAPNDMFVWRLDLQGNPFVRWSGHAKVAALAVRHGDTVRQPKLLGAKARRLLDMTSCFVPSSTVKQDADGTVHELWITTRLYRFGAFPWTVRKVRAEYEMDDAASDNPTMRLEIASGLPPIYSFSLLSASGPEGDQAWPWTITRRGRTFRARFRSSGPAARVAFKGFEISARANGRR